MEQLVNDRVCLREYVQAKQLDVIVLKVFDSERLFVEGFYHFPMVEGKACLNHESPLIITLMILVVDPKENIVELNWICNLVDILS